MKKLKCMLIVIIMLFLIVGCFNAGENTDESGTAAPNINQEASIQDIENAFVDFSKKENWEIAYTYMKILDKPIKEFSNGYMNLKYKYSYGGSVIYEAPESGLLIYITDMDDVSDYSKYTLTGEEICGCIAQQMKFFFPDSKWSGSVEETKEYFNSYLGIDLEFKPDGTDEGYFALAKLSQNNCDFYIWSESEIIAPEDYMEIWGYEGFILE